MSEQINFINHTVKAYHKESLWLLAGVTLLVLLVMSIKKDLSPLDSLLTCVILTFVCNVAYIESWRATAKVAWKKLTMFYLAASAVRLFVMLAALLIGCLILKAKAVILIYVVILSVYYILMLIFDSFFFTRVEKSNKTMMK
jgi:hypothetical protein